MLTPQMPRDAEHTAIENREGERRSRFGEVGMNPPRGGISIGSLAPEGGNHFLKIAKMS